MAEEVTPATSASETDQSTAGAAATGAVGDGSAGGTDSTVTAESLAAERERLEATSRELQASRDRERAAREAAERELAALKGETKPDTPAAASLDPKAFYAEVSKFGALERKAESLRETCKYADAALFERAIEFDSVEALEAAIKASHEKVASLIAGETDAQVQAKLAEASARYGVQLVAPATAPETPSGEPTFEQWAAMSMDEQDAWEEKVPGLGERIIRSAYEQKG